MAETTQEPQHRVLIVDDEPAVLKLVAAMLGKHGHEILTADSGAAALTLLRNQSVDCVVTDAIMPEMSGYDLVKMIRRNSELAELPIVMLTRKRHREDVKLAVEAGVTDYVLKPIDEHLLAEKVELALKKGAGKRHIYEGTIHGPKSAAELGFDCRVITLSEADITMRVPINLGAGATFNLRSGIFEEIGIPLPHLKLISCRELAELPDAKGLPFEARFAFIGVPEDDLKKIRSWLQKEEIKRRK